jgi:F-type H+-transporting ATPase subunit a
MASESFSPAEYIGHHLTFFTRPAGEGTEAAQAAPYDFWVVNVDSVIVATLLGIVGLGFFWWVARGATAGVPGKRQAFVELCFRFIDNQVKDIFHGDRHKFVAPFALTVGLWVLLMNAMDFLPVDWVGMVLPHHGFRIVPTADTNTTFALALSVWLMMIGFGIKEKGLGGWLHELFCAPFGSNPIMWPLNLLFNIVEYVSKPLSHSLRLFGNMYAGEIIFLLLWMLAVAGIGASIAAVVMGLGWAIFHILIVGLQAYIFMMLAVVYIQMAHEGH